MTDDNQDDGMDIIVEEYTGDEQPFVPGGDIIDVELDPIPDDEKGFYPGKSDKGEFPFPVVPTKPLILDIETTGIKPWESRIICIGVYDATTPTNEPLVFLHDDEKVIVESFIHWFMENKFTEIIGYNVAFDIRFIYAVCCRYRIPAPFLLDVKFTDLMQIMKQVKEAFVFNLNTPGTLEQWSIYLFGKQKTLTYKELMQAWADKDIDKILMYNANDVLMTRDLWALSAYVLQSYFATGANGATTIGEENLDTPGESRTVRCPVCLGDFEVPTNATSFFCPVCNATRQL